MLFRSTDPGGRVTISARPSPEGERCIIEVVDTGIWIDPALHERVFERFFQADSGGTRAYGGMGVGLALVKVLTEAHGASVSLESTPGKGTCVRLDWPSRAPSETAAAGDGQVDLTASRQSQITHEPGSVTG